MDEFGCPGLFRTTNCFHTSQGNGEKLRIVLYLNKLTLRSNLPESLPLKCLKTGLYNNLIRNILH